MISDPCPILEPLTATENKLNLLVRPGTLWNLSLGKGAYSSAAPTTSGTATGEPGLRLFSMPHTPLFSLVFSSPLLSLIFAYR
jgi:hypothetical protein